MSPPSAATTTRPTLVCRAKGGIGNQLFQLAFASSLAQRLDARLMADTSYFAADPYGFAATVFDLRPDIGRTRVADHLGADCDLLQEGQIADIRQVQRLPAGTRHLVLDGYWQGESYFDTATARSIHAALMDAVLPQLDQALLDSVRGARHGIAVHLRRRDYAHMGLCRHSYYLAALDHLMRAQPGAELFVFSDEPNCTRHLLALRPYPFRIVSSGSDIGDLCLMSLCRSFVIANSSYSWWAAWFAEHASSRPTQVVCPHEWVTLPGAAASPCPARWTRLRGAVEPHAVVERELAAFASQLRASADPGLIRSAA